jgi:hypothetical protein
MHRNKKKRQLMFTNLDMHAKMHGRMMIEVRLTHIERLSFIGVEV